MERPSWTAATVILAADVLAGDSPTSGFFRELECDDGELDDPFLPSDEPRPSMPAAF